jgi:hypothetical protein
MAEPLKQINPFDKFDEQANPFDKFDTTNVGENPFNKFDENPKAEPSLLEKVGDVITSPLHLLDQPAKTFETAIPQVVSNPISAGAKILTGVGETMAVPFTALDAGLRKIGLSNVADVAAYPFQKIAEGTQAVSGAIQKGIDYLGVPKEIQNLGLSPEKAQQASEAVGELNQMATQFLVPAVAGKLPKIIKEKIASNKVLTPLERSKVLDTIPKKEVDANITADALADKIVNEPKPVFTPEEAQFYANNAKAVESSLAKVNAKPTEKYSSLTPDEIKSRQDLASKETTISPARSSETGVASLSSETIPEKGMNPLEGSKTSAGLPSTSGEISTNLPSVKTENLPGDIKPPLVDEINIKNVSDKSKGKFTLFEDDGSLTHTAVNKGSTFTVDEAIASMDKHRDLNKQILDKAKNGDLAGAQEMIKNYDTNPQFHKEAAEGFIAKTLDIQHTNFTPENVRKLLNEIKTKQSIPKEVQTGLKTSESPPSGITPADKNVTATSIQETTPKYPPEGNLGVEKSTIPPTTESGNVIQNQKLGELPKVTEETIRSQTPPVQELQTVKKGEHIVPPKVIEPTPTITEGAGETKIRGLAKSTEAKAIAKGLTDKIENLPEYEAEPNKPKVNFASELIANDPEKAMRIVEGKETIPQKDMEGFISKGLEVYATQKGDPELIIKLARTEFTAKKGTEYGRFVQSLREQDPLSPVNAIKEIIKLREESHIGKRNAVLTEKFEKQIKTLEEKLVQKDEQIQKIQAERSLRKIAREEGYTTRQTKRVIKKETLDAEYEQLLNEFVKVSGKITAGLDPQQTAVVIKITRNRVQSGLVSAEKIIDDAYQFLADKVEGITKKDIRDAISGYGRTSEKTRSDLAKTMNDLRQQMRIVSKIEAIESGEAITKRTVNKTTPSKELIALKQELKTKLQESGIKEEESLSKSKERIKKTLGEIEDKIARGDYAKVERPTTPMDAEKARLQQELKTMRTRWNDIQKNLGETITTEEAGNIAKLSKGASEAKKKMESSPRRGLGEPATEAEMEYGRKRVAFAQYVDGLKDNANKMTWQEFKSSPLGSMVKSASHIPGLTKSMKATFDNSGLFNQHIKTLMTHPVVWQRNALKSFQDIYRTLGGKNVMGEIVADMVSRPNFEKYKTDKLAINTIEEAFPDSRLLEKIPYLGKVHQAANTAYTGLAYRNRMDLYDLYTEIAKNSGHDVTTGLGIGEVVNSLTGRGKLGALEKSGNAINVLLFAPRFVKSHFDVLTAHAGNKDVTPFMKKEAAKNLAKIIGSSAAVMITANAIKPGSAETDPRSSDFGSIKVGNTRFHFMGGMNSLLTLGSRLATLSSKSTTTGEVTPLNSGKFGAKSGWDVLLNFGEGKLAPVAGLARDVLKGQTFGGERLTVGGELKNLTVPLPITNAQEFLNDPKSAPIVIGMIADGLGIFTSTYSNDPALRKVQNTILKADQEKMSETARSNFFDNARTALRNGSITRKQFDDYSKQFNELQKTAKPKVKK